MFTLNWGQLGQTASPHLFSFKLLWFCPFANSSIEHLLNEQIEGHLYSTSQQVFKERILNVCVYFTDILNTCMNEIYLKNQ